MWEGVQVKLTFQGAHPVFRIASKETTSPVIIPVGRIRQHKRRRCRTVLGCQVRTPDDPVTVLRRRCRPETWAAQDIVISPDQFWALCSLHEELARWDDVVVGVRDIGVVAIPPWWRLDVRLLLLVLLMLILLLSLLLLQLLIYLLDQVQESRVLLCQI